MAQLVSSRSVAAHVGEVSRRGAKIRKIHVSNVFGF